MSDETNKIQQIPTDLIDDPKSAIRSRVSDSALYELADSIRDIGLIQPIIVKRVGGRFEVIVGHRRLVASKLAGRLAIPAIVSDVDDARADAIKLHENIVREDVNPVDQARLIKKVLDQSGLSVLELADRLKRSETFIRSRLALLDWDPKIIDAVYLDKISFSAAYWFAKITDPIKRLYYLDVAVRQGISPSLARDWYKSWEAKRLPEPPPRVEIVEPETGERVEFYVEPCRICGKPIKMGEEQVLFVHPQCLKDVEKGVPTIEQ